jgi:antitoxin component YwqK of YwqJK toxin-antitoxin module
MFDLLFSTKKKCLKEGRWKEFNKHAVLISVGHYQEGHKHGHWLEYYDTGELMLEENYDQGVLHGRFATYHLNGNLLSEGTYIRGSREGLFKVYNETGLHIKSLLFVGNDLMKEIDATSTVHAT